MAAAKEINARLNRMGSMQLSQRGLLIQSPPVRTQMDPGQNDFLVTFLNQPPNLLQNLVRGRTSRPTTHHGDDAIGAARVASVLNLDERSCPTECLNVEARPTHKANSLPSPESPALLGDYCPKDPKTLAASSARYFRSAAASRLSLRASIAAANRTALVAPAAPTAIVATGIPAGI